MSELNYITLTGKVNTQFKKTGGIFGKKKTESKKDVDITGDIVFLRENWKKQRNTDGKNVAKLVEKGKRIGYNNLEYVQIVRP